MRPVQVITAFASLSVFASAWPWDGLEGGKAVAGIENMLYRRQDSGTTSTKKATGTITAKATATDKTTATGKTSGTAKDSASGTAKGTDSASASGTDGASASDSGASASGTKASKTTGKGSKTTEYDPRDPAGGIAMITPNIMSGAQYYKIGDHVTFAWNYTSLSSTPSHIDVLATCSANQATYTIALNQTVKETGMVVWDTEKFKNPRGNSPPLLTEKYTLIIYDAESSISATPRAGYLAPYNQFIFAMYTPQPYQPLDEFNCPTCNAGVSLAERQTLFFLFSMMTVTILSFTWFGSGRFGIF